MSILYKPSLLLVTKLRFELMWLWGVLTFEIDLCYNKLL